MNPKLTAGEGEGGVRGVELHACSCGAHKTAKHREACAV